MTNRETLVLGKANNSGQSDVGLGLPPIYYERSGACKCGASGMLADMLRHVLEKHTGSPAEWINITWEPGWNAVKLLVDESRSVVEQRASA